MFSKSLPVFLLITLLFLFSACKEKQNADPVKLEEVKDKIESSEETQPKMAYTVSLGIMPDMSFKGKGMRIGQVNKDKAAFKAGLLKGDLILEMDGKKIDDLVAYTRQLGTYKKGDSSELIVQRDEQRIKVKVDF